jgi:eukaryotic-like serine/threonine-protein kinase
MDQPPPSRDSILEQLNRVLASSSFEGAGRSKALLKFLVEESVSGKGGALKEYTIGSEALGRGESFDPRTDPIVRAEASRLRGRLERYYATEGRTDPVIIVLPKGSYVPQFQEQKPEGRELPTSTRRELSRERNLLWGAAFLVVAALAFAAGILTHWRTRPSIHQRVIQFDVALTSKGTIGGEVGTAVILSPDGTRVVFIAEGNDGVPHLYARRLEESQVTELPGTEGARVPFFSPDGLWVGFWAAEKLKKTSLEGGSPIVLCDAADLLGASWGENGQIIASFGGPMLLRIPASGGAPKVILDLSKKSEHPAWPQILPGGNAVLYTAISFSGPNYATIEALSLTSGETNVLARGGTFGRFLPGSYVTYVNQGTLFAVPFDLKRLQARGSPTPVLEGVSYSSEFGYAELDFSRTGDLVYRKNSGGQLVVQWVDETGKTEPLLSRPGNYLWPRLSPNGKRLALSVTESGESGLWIYEGPPERFTRLPVPGTPHLPLWTPDGRFLVLGGAGGLTWLGADGTAKPHMLLPGNAPDVPVSWASSPSGTRLAFHRKGQATGFDLWTVPVHISADGLTAGKPEVFLQTPAFEVYPTFSPDGRWIAYGSNESGSWEVYVRAFPNDGRWVQVSTTGGRIPLWSRTRHELLYRTDDQRIMAAAYEIKNGEFVIRSVRRWSPIRLADTGVLSNLDLGPDGKRMVGLFPAANPEDQDSENHVTFMLNFADEVDRRLASAKY